MKPIPAKFKKADIDYEYLLDATDHALYERADRNVDWEIIKFLIENFIEELFDVAEEDCEAVLQHRSKKVSLAVKPYYKRNGDFVVLVKTVADFILHPHKDQTCLAI